MIGRILQGWRGTVAACALAVGSAVAYVDSAHPLSPGAGPSCAVDSEGIRWVRLSAANERPTLDRWCFGVGPPVRIEAPRVEENFASSIAIVSWNVHVGGGDLDGLVADLRGGKLTGRRETDFILLLQEAYRDGEVPTLATVAWAAAVQPVLPHRTRTDVGDAATRLGLWAVYVPSMRNGRPGATAEDRGNAILSTRPLSDVAAIELPLERQRRIALAATARIAGRQVRIVDTHFTNMVMHHLWVLSESGRLRQARALAQALPRDTPLIVAGDFNAWFGFRDAAYREMARGMSRAEPEDRRATFGPLRLDHVLFRLPAGWRSSLRRPDDKYGSDHYPLVAIVDAR